MCGILGFASTGNSELRKEKLRDFFDHLLILSESRGKDASGLTIIQHSEITVLKRAIRAKYFIKSSEYSRLFEKLTNLDRNLDKEKNAFAILGHARMVTNGSEETHENNQPVIKNGMICLHNGIIVNDQELSKLHPYPTRAYEVDTEVIPNLVSHYRSSGLSFIDAFQETFKQLKGANSIALVADDLDIIVLATTNGSLYYARSISGNELVFASERYFLEHALIHKTVKKLFISCPVIQIKPSDIYLFKYQDLLPILLNNASARDNNALHIPIREKGRQIHDLKPTSKGLKTHDRGLKAVDKKHTDISELVFINYEAIARLRRCSRCLLPQTFPFISYDEEGICNYCNSYQKLEFAGEGPLRNVVEPYRNKSGQPDCIVALSGGRDSTYGLHYVKNVLRLNPLAYTYDWGMVTDLARRNISRICGSLGIEHILVSANIKKKRSYIRKNVLAWLKKPDLGTIPLFMAGDKQYFYYANKLMKQYAIDLFIMSENRLERTHFKHGFCGIKHSDSHAPPYFLNLIDKIKMVEYYGQQYLKNPALLNRSLIDTIGAYISYYVIPHHYLYLYNYIEWNEKEIERLLIDQYEWEVAPDTKSTWRIGDGTAAFYNYIYYRVAGFTENDTFRSNQIREGLMTRKEAMEIASADNRPRPESIKWYCDTIGIDVEYALREINQIPTLYEK